MIGEGEEILKIEILCAWITGRIGCRDLGVDEVEGDGRRCCAGVYVGMSTSVSAGGGC